jgi:hypothetical protein
MIRAGAGLVEEKARRLLALAAQFHETQIYE